MRILVKRITGEEDRILIDYTNNSKQISIRNVHMNFLLRFTYQTCNQNQLISDLNLYFSAGVGIIDDDVKVVWKNSAQFTGKAVN